MPTYNDLPREIKSEISKFLAPSEVANLEKVCKELKVTNDPVNAPRVLKERLNKVKERLNKVKNNFENLQDKLKKLPPYIPGLQKSFANEKIKLLEQYREQLLRVVQLGKVLRGKPGIDDKALAEALRGLPEVLQLSGTLRNRIENWL